MTIEVLDSWTITLSAPGDTATHDLPVGVALQEGDVIVWMEALHVYYPYTQGMGTGWINDDVGTWLPGAISGGGSISHGGLQGGYMDFYTAGITPEGVHYSAYGATEINYEYLGEDVGSITRGFVLIRGSVYRASTDGVGFDTETRMLTPIEVTDIT